MSLTATEVNQLKQAPATEDILPVVRHRWSPRSFSDREVSGQDLRTIFEAVRWTASSYNEQPWRFFVGHRGSDTYQKIFDSLGEFNQVWAKSAPVLIMGVTKTKFSHNGSENSVALFDLGAASITLCYQAMALGLHTHQMAGFSREKARQLFGFPEDFLPGSVIALGYQGEPSALKSEQMLQQEIAPRERKALGEIVLSAWGKAAQLS